MKELHIFLRNAGRRGRKSYQQFLDGAIYMGIQTRNFCISGLFSPQELREEKKVSPSQIVSSSSFSSFLSLEHVTFASSSSCKIFFTSHSREKKKKTQIKITFPSRHIRIGAHQRLFSHFLIRRLVWLKPKMARSGRFLLTKVAFFQEVRNLLTRVCNEL